MPLRHRDVFAAGIGCDVAGAWLLARGLIASSEQIHFAGLMTFGGNPEAWARGVRDRVDATFGIFWLAVGFSVQVLGYALSLAFEPNTPAGVVRALLAVALAFGAWAMVQVVDRATYRSRLRRAAIALGRVARVDGEYETRALPSGKMLRVLGERVLNQVAREGEDDSAYARRVWDVERVSDHSAY
jgi:membrane protein implicated in regulation of membrane protease activity